MIPSAGDLLRTLANEDDLHVLVVRDDAITFGAPTWIWSVIVDGRLYVRAYNGGHSRWYRAAVRNHVGRVRSRGRRLGDRIDDAYRAKYAGSPYLEPMIAAGPRNATIEIVLRTKKEKNK